MTLELPMNLLVNCGWRRQKAAPLPIGWGEGKEPGASALDKFEAIGLRKNFPSPNPMRRGLGRGALCTRFMVPMRTKVGSHRDRRDALSYYVLSNV